VLLALWAWAPRRRLAPKPVNNLYQPLYASLGIVASISGQLTWMSERRGFTTSFCVRDLWTDGSSVQASVRYVFDDGTEGAGPSFTTASTTCPAFPPTRRRRSGWCD
jgi:hypothetical protein